MPDYIGNYACYFSLGSLRGMTTEDWMKRMEKNFHRTSPYEVSDGQRRAWRSSYEALRAAIDTLPESYRQLHVVFEYVLPRHAPNTNRAADDVGIRADAIIVSEDTAVVLEFKQKEERFDGDVNQATMYRRRLQRFHRQSIGMNKKAVLILTRASALEEHLHRAEVCSPDMLADTLRQILGDAPKRNADINKWINSEFAAR